MLNHVYIMNQTKKHTFKDFIIPLFSVDPLNWPVYLALETQLWDTRDSRGYKARPETQLWDTRDSRGYKARPETRVVNVFIFF